MLVLHVKGMWEKKQHYLTVNNDNKYYNNV